MEPITTGIKTCIRCNKEKNVLAFAASKKSIDGLKPHCRECAATENRKYYKPRKMPIYFVT